MKILRNIGWRKREDETIELCKRSDEKVVAIWDDKGKSIRKDCTFKTFENHLRESDLIVTITVDKGDGKYPLGPYGSARASMPEPMISVHQAYDELITIVDTLPEEAKEILRKVGR